jgi:hypothetical protein
MFNNDGFSLESSNVIDMEISQAIAMSMEISTGLGFGHVGDEDQDDQMASLREIERVWGAFLSKVKFSAGFNYLGSLQSFALSDTAHILDSKVVNTLNDKSQKEDAVLFGLKDGRVAFVW